MDTLLFILKLFPYLLQVIQAIEMFAPVAQAGPAKMDLLMGAVTDSLKSEPFTSKSFSPDQLLSLIQAIAVSIVSFYNILGIFRKTPVAPAPVTAPTAL